MTHLRVGPLVRATNATSVVIWAELPYSCTILLHAQPLHTNQLHMTSVRTHTVTLGGRHYAAPQLQKLQAATWYTYEIAVVTQAEQEEHIEPIDESLVSCFRTMDADDENSTPQQLRVAYGSCRKFVAPQVDALSAFGRWLREHDAQKEVVWPHLLLLIGDQIYADQPSQEIKQQYPQLQHGAQTFEDFALLYEYVWTQDSDVRQVLACIPTFMIFDDHEITNNWNITPQWCAMMLASGQEQVLVDGLIAYWVYQGWGNLTQRDEALYPLLHFMREGEQSGEDILEALRAYIRREVRNEQTGRWHYEIQTVPPIFVLNARSERTAIFTQQQGDIYGPTRILSQTQMQEIATWLQKHDTRPSLLVSSVPVLLPPLIGLAELTNDCLWEWNLETKEIFWIDGGHKRVFGYEIENALIPQIFWENRIHPEDRKRVLISLENIRVLNPSMIWQQEYRFRKADGQYIQVRDQGKLLRDKDQDMFRMIGTTTDISVEKSLELELVSERLKKKAVISMEGFRAQENERFDIASELHNNLGQILCAAKLHIEFASSHEESRPDCLALASQYVVTVINEIRAVCKKLRMPGMYQGFFESVRHAIQNLNRNYPVFIEFNVVYYTGKKRI